MDENRSGVWSIYKFDPAEFITTNLIQLKDFSSLSGISTENTILRTFEAFSTIVVRGIFVSNNSYTINNLPKEMSIRTSNNYNVTDIYYYDVCNGEIKEVEQAKQDENAKVEIPSTKVKKYETEDLNGDIDEINKKGSMLQKENIKRKKENIVEETMKKLARTEAKPINKQDIKDEVQNNFELKEMNNELLRKNMDNLNQEYIDNKKEALKNLFRKEEHKRTPLLPDPMMHLSYVLGYTAQNCPSVLYNSNGEYDTNPNIYQENKENPLKKHIYFTSGSTLIRYDPFNIKQTFFFGHSKPINNYILACKGEIIFSSQDGPNSIIRIWRAENGRSLKMLTTPFDKVKVLTESRDSKYLCTTGIEAKNKESIILWDISNLDDIKVFIRQCSPVSINYMKFSPFEPNILVSCGKENIRFWRIKNDHLTGKPVVLNEFSRDTNFLCLDFNNTMFGDEYYSDKGKLFVGTSKGCVCQIACNNQELEAVYKVQDASLLSIAVNEAFCVTGSFDGYLRVWPIDFSEFLIEAKHDSGVCSIDISYDAIDILCGTLNGSIGILNMQNKLYKTVLRSPPTVIKKMIAHPSGNYLFTIEDNKSVRVWDIDHKSEAFQFVSSKDPPTALAAPTQLMFSCGFASGIIKVFDLEKTEILYECKPFQSSVTNLQYIQKDKFLISMSAQGNMSIHDAGNDYIQIKILKIDQAARYTDLSLSIDEDYFASIGPESNCVLVWNAMTFGIKNRVPISNFFIKKVSLVNKNLLAVILENCCVRFYSLCTYEGIFIKEMMNIHINNVSQFFSTKNFKFLISAGAEGMIKIWDMKMVFKQLQSFQQFIVSSTQVNSVLILENKSLLISCSENGGINFWNFLGDITFTETEITQDLEKLGDSTLMREAAMKTTGGKKKMAQTTSMASSKGGFYNPSNTAKPSENTTSNIRIKHMEKAYKAENPSYEIIKKGNKTEPDVNETKGNVLSMLPVMEDKDAVDLNYSKTEINLTQEDLEKYTTNNDDSSTTNANDLLNKLLFGTKYLPPKMDKFIWPENSSQKINLKYCLGLSVNSMHNLIFNKNDKWYAYTVNNKIIIEFLESERTQLVLSDCKDELSCLVLSPNGKYLVAGVGCVNREEYAAILVYNTSNFELKKKLSFHFKGVQRIAISQNGKYMISIGSKEEKSVCVWNFTNLTVIDSKSVKFSIIDLVCERQNEVFLYFVTIAQNVISFWRMDANFKLEGFHINFEDLTQERMLGEFLTSVEITPYYENIKTSFVIVGTNKGNILILDKEKKIVIRKYIISKFPLTHLYYNNTSFVCCGEGPLIFQWNYDSSKISMSNVFQFFEKEKANLFFVDSCVSSIQITPSGKESLIITDIGSIFFVNFEEKTTLKILSSHINCKIPSLECDGNNEDVFSCGKDGSVRCWTVDSFDQKYQLLKLDQQPDSCVINQKENILLIHYESSYLRLYNLSTLKSLGVIRLPDADISHFALLFNNQAILLTTHQEKMFLIDVQNWEPLSLLHSELFPTPSSIPKNQYCKSLECKNITTEKAYAIATFSDGTVSTFLIEKINSKVEITTIDTFNMIEIHMSKTDDSNIKEMYSNLGKYRSDYMAGAKFSNHFDGVSLCYHECLQFLYVRNYSKNEMIKSIPLNYFPYSIGLSDDEKFIAVGSKEGIILFITRTEETFASGFNLDIFKGHYDSVDMVRFSNDMSKLFTTSYSELFVWDIAN